jgi:peptidoglycan/LPS O-acetylase OafA/YrhL
MAGHFRGGFFEEYGLLANEDKTLVVQLLYALTHLGHECVLIFFVMSGFLVGGKALERMRERRFNLVDYSIDRTVRIVLPLISALLLYIPITYYMGKSVNWWHWLGNLFSLQGIVCGSVIGPLWSLSYEVWFYIVIGIIAFVFSRNDRIRHIVWPCMLAVILVFMQLKVYYLFIWLLGAASYLLMPKSPSKIVLIISGFFVAVCLFFLQLTGDTRAFDLPIMFVTRPVMEVLFSFAFCIFLQQVILHKPRKAWTIRLNNLGTRLAAFSYTLYLIHPLVQDLLTYLGAPKSAAISLTSVSLYLLWLLLGMAVSYGVYMLFEKNTGLLKQKIKNTLSN